MDINNECYSNITSYGDRYTCVKNTFSCNINIMMNNDIINITTDAFSLSYKTKPDVDISINLELFRGELYCDLLKQFTKSCLTNLNDEVFSHKKNYHRTITNLLASWFFTMYIEYDFSNDAFFPSNYLTHDKIIIRTLKDYTSLHNIYNVDVKINNIVNDLHVSYNLVLYKLLNYKQINHEITITKELNKFLRNGEFINFYMLSLHSTHILCNKLHNIINNIMLPVDQYENMKSRYVGSNKMDNYIWTILYRYQLLSSNNHQLAVIPKIYDAMKTDFNLSVECFASAINSSSNYFCSLYYDVEKYFGSIGNFFQLTCIAGVYSFNPPYQHDVMTLGFMRMLGHLDNSNEQLTFIITIPIWDNIGKKTMEEMNMENNNNTIEYDDFEIMNIIRDSKHFRGLRMISKNNFTYMDHNFYLFKNKTIQNTYVLVMSNRECNYIDTINKYNFFE